MHAVAITVQSDMGNDLLSLLNVLQNVFRNEKWLVAGEIHVLPLLHPLAVHILGNTRALSFLVGDLQPSSTVWKGQVHSTITLKIRKEIIAEVLVIGAKFSFATSTSTVRNVFVLANLSLCIMFHLPMDESNSSEICSLKQLRHSASFVLSRYIHGHDDFNLARVQTPQNESKNSRTLLPQKRAAATPLELASRPSQKKKGIPLMSVDRGLRRPQKGNKGSATSRFAEHPIFEAMKQAQTVAKRAMKMEKKTFLTIASTELIGRCLNLTCQFCVLKCVKVDSIAMQNSLMHRRAKYIQRCGGLANCLAQGGDGLNYTQLVLKICSTTGAGLSTPNPS